MKKLIMSIATIAAVLTVALPVQAETRTYTERECSTDSYGNTTCRDKTTNIETGVITYSNQTVNGYATGSTIRSGYSTGGVAYTTTVQDVAILNTALPTGSSLAAGIIVALGGLSMALKLWLRRAN